MLSLLLVVGSLLAMGLCKPQEGHGELAHGHIIGIGESLDGDVAKLEDEGAHREEQRGDEADGKVWHGAAKNEENKAEEKFGDEKPGADSDSSEGESYGKEGSGEEDGDDGGFLNWLWQRSAELSARKRRVA